jgi:hypothetical protein
VEQNRNKKVVYRTCVNNACNRIAPGSSFNFLINSGILHPTGVIIVPFIGAVANSGFGDFQWKSPLILAQPQLRRRIHACQRRRIHACHGPATT